MMGKQPARFLFSLLAITVFIIASVVVLVPTSHVKAAPSISGLHVSGNQLLNGNNEAIRLLGVNRSGTEYKCVNNAGIFDGPNDAASVDAIANWYVNVVRVPLNEDCWLGINNAPAAYSGSNYQQAIVDYVNLLNSKGLIAVLDLHWTAPGTTLPFSQQAMPDVDHSIDFWNSVAGTFKNNSSVIFDLFNEPFPNAPNNGGWQCWRDGSTVANGGSCSDVNFAVAGMQTLVNTVRTAGANNVIMLTGIGYGNWVGGWLDYVPSDPQNNLMASSHIYTNSGCNSTSCYDQIIAPVAAKYPVVMGELGESDCAHSFIDTAMGWADQNGVGYMGWAWDTYDCGGFPSLISNYDGTPTAFGVGFRNHFAVLAGQPIPTPTPTPTPTPLPTGTLDRSTWTLSASSTATNGDSLAKAIDGNLGTRWSSGAFQTPGQWFQIDTGSIQSIDKIVLDASSYPGDAPISYKVYLSKDASDWDAVASGAGQPVTTITFKAQRARYIKIVQTGSSTSNWWSIDEVNAYSPPPIPEIPLDRSVWQLLASDTAKNGDSLAKAIDGDLTTRWSTGAYQTKNQWFLIDTGSIQAFNQIVLDATNSPTDGPIGYKVQISKDGLDWSDSIASGAGQAVTTITFKTRHARYIRIIQTGSSSSYWWSIDEVNVYAQAPDTTSAG